MTSHGWSDFPPLLAFPLSLAARGNERAQRAAFLAAYAALPVLYAAYNTFPPLNDWIMGGFMHLSGASAGSPLDPWDSLVIPPAMALALWVWRGMHAKEGLRTRLHLYAVVIAALATVATSPFEPSETKWWLGTSTGNTIVFEGGDYDSYSSSDGGLTWVEDTSYWYETDQFEWATSSVETPRGTYSVEGDSIVLQSPNGERRTVHSVGYLSESSNLWTQKITTWDLRRSLTVDYEYDDKPEDLIVTVHR